MREDDDVALTAREKRTFKFLVAAVFAIALICCGAGIGLGVALA